jgi:asparagine synthase (glutamine-hydrolysing)
MSGIAGIIHFDGKPVEPGLIEKMTSAMAHRGPDGINHWRKGPVALGHCMLRTTPESLEEHQPVTNEDERLVLVMDGRVDNWEDLRRELLGRGAVLRNRSDAELVLRAYEIWGQDFLAHIDGDFALAIWDDRRQEVFCARDRIGNKPLHYHWNGRTFAFSSGANSILNLPWVSETVNDGMLAEFLAFEWFSRDQSLWQGVFRLIPAHWLTIDHRGPRRRKYWDPNLGKALPYTSDQEYIEHYHALLLDVVARMSRSHHTVAYHVSGGLDSSAIFCVAEHLHRSGSLPAPSIDAYTLAFADDSAGDDLRYARAIGAYLGKHIKEIPPSRLPNSSFTENADIGRTFPGYPNASMFFGIRDKIASDGIRALLTGEGGDEFLQGSRAYYADELVEHRWSNLLACLRCDLSLFGLPTTMHWFMRYGVYLSLPVRLQGVMRGIFRRLRGTPSNDPYWLSPQMLGLIKKRREDFGACAVRKQEGFGQHELRIALEHPFVDHIIEGDDYSSARVGIETRHPLRSSKIIEFAFATPERLRLRGSRGKYIHAQALGKLMPQAVLDRIDKGEFSVVFRENLDRMEALLTNELPRERAEWIEKEGITRLYKRYRERPEQGFPFWVLWSIYGCYILMRQKESNA